MLVGAMNPCQYSMLPGSRPFWIGLQGSVAANY
jgi:hypothetical protein